MGTIYIEEYHGSGSKADRALNINDLTTLTVLTKDATTSSTAESITLGNDTKVVTIYAVEAHRVCLDTDTSASLYAFIPAGVTRDFGVVPGGTLYYELDA